ncbi:hypothetical protein HY989_06005 [Candidatus Micrarchaeota archaeon]|nr:hypothetical protein [Candidatus Micrarchaeota archaeon]
MEEQTADPNPKKIGNGKDEALKVIIDDRELRSNVARLLFSSGIKLHPKRLDVADFIINEQVAIERKSANDFESSIMDGRLFEQCKNMAANFSNPLLCIIGREFTRLQKRAVIGAKISIATDYKIPVFEFDGDEEFVEFLNVLLVQKERGKKDMRLRFEKKAVGKDDSLQMVLEGMQMIGPVHAKNILAKFKTLQKVFSASESSLQKVEGVGETRARQIRRIATARYGEEDELQEKIS